MWLGRGRRLRLLGGFVLAVALVFLATSVAAPSSAQSALACSPSWQTVPIAPTPDGYEIDGGVAAQSPTDAWAAGGDGLNAPSFIERWDGAQWSLSWQAPQDNVSPWSLALNGVAAAAPSAAWAVGGSGYRIHPVIMSWNGSSWRTDHTPTLPHEGSLYAVAAVAPNDAWAVGAMWKHLRSWTLVEHWNGSSWQVVPSPNGGPSTLVRTTKGSGVPSGREPLSVSTLATIAVISPDDIWAVGGYDRALPSRTERGTYRPDYRVSLLNEHWNGTKWTLGPTPVMESRALPRNGLPTYGLDGIAAAPSGDLIGAADGRVWRFSGSTWTPDPSWKPIYDLMATTVTGPDDAWAMGSLSPDDLAAAHWDGNQWTPTTTLPATGTIDEAAASGPNDSWAAGNLNPTTGDTNQQVMLHYTC